MWQVSPNKQASAGRRSGTSKPSSNAPWRGQPNLCARRRPDIGVGRSIQEQAAAVVSALVETNISDAFREAVRVNSKLPERQFRRELDRFLQRFERKPGGAA
jgi:hypothetical protein